MSLLVPLIECYLINEMLVKEKENHICIQAFSSCLLFSAGKVVIMVKT